MRGGPPAHLVTDTPNLVSSSVTRDGLEEQATALAVFLAGEDFQGRVGIERGHMPVHKAAIDSPTSVAPPPDGMQWLKAYADRPANRSRFTSAHGGSGGSATGHWGTKAGRRAVAGGGARGMPGVGR